MPAACSPKASPKDVCRSWPLPSMQAFRQPRRSAASWDPQLATMLAMVGPGATALKRGPLGPYITAEFLVRPTTACSRVWITTPVALHPPYP